MLNILRKIVKIGTVTENWTDYVPPERSRGEVVISGVTGLEASKLTKICPTRAISVQARSLVIDFKSCIFCGQCVRNDPGHFSENNNYKLATLSESIYDDERDILQSKIHKIFGRSLHIRHVDAGSCNACDFEMSHLSNPIYDIQQYGIDFVPSPRHADMLMVTGVVTRNLTQALQMTYEATPFPKLVMAVGACACSGQVFGDSYAIRGGVDTIVPVDVYVPGCPPRPQALIHGIMLILDRL